MTVATPNDCRSQPLCNRTLFNRTGICHGTFEIVPQEVLWSIWGSHQTLWSLPLPNVTRHSGTWPYTMTPSIVQTLHLLNLLPNLTLIPILTLLPNFGGFHGTLQRVRLANRGRLLLRTPGPVPFGTCICSNVETILSWTCYVYGPFEFRTSLGTSTRVIQKLMQCWQYHDKKGIPSQTDCFAPSTCSSCICTSNQNRSDLNRKSI